VPSSEWSGTCRHWPHPAACRCGSRTCCPAAPHDLTAARELVLPEARPYLKDLPFLADSGYEAAGAGVLVPVRKPARRELDPDTKTRNVLLRSLRYQGERGFALMSQRWRALQRVMLSPTTIGDITTARTLLKAWPLTA
jgi:DDE superfamily endonuclease